MASVRLAQRDLNGRFVKALGGLVRSVDNPDGKPLELRASLPLPPQLRVYTYNATHPPGERSEGDRKIQLIVPGQPRGSRGRLDYSGDSFVVLAGYEVEWEVFILWDADLYREFTYSRNVQVKRSTVFAALSEGLATQKRRLHSGEVDTVLAATADNLVAALLRRMDLRVDRLVKL